jgi:hypothetical protein
VITGNGPILHGRGGLEHGAKEQPLILDQPTRLVAWGTRLVSDAHLLRKHFFGLGMRSVGLGVFFLPLLNCEARLPLEEQLSLKLRRFIEANIPELTVKVRVENRR